MTTTEPVEPCGSIRVLREYQGEPEATVWCERTAGPCPWPGTREAGHDRICGASGARRMRVRWAESCIADALVEIKAFHARAALGVCNGDLTEQTVAIARDAIVMCVEPTP